MILLRLISWAYFRRHVLRTILTVAGIVLGNSKLPYRVGLQRVHDALAWLSQVTMFVMLGLLVFPSRLLEIAPVALPLALFLTVIARPVVVWLCLLPFRYPGREVAYISWVGLRGAVPIVLATYPLLSGASGADRRLAVRAPHRG